MGNYYDPNKRVQDMSLSERREYKKSKRAKEWEQQQKELAENTIKNSIIEDNQMTYKERQIEMRKPIIDEETANRSLGTQRGKMISERIRKRLEDFEQLDSFVDSMIENAKKGNASLCQEILNRIEGKLKEQIDISTHIKDIAPSQEESQGYDKQFKAIKALPKDNDIYNDMPVNTLDNNVSLQDDKGIDDAD